jgi:hypothetical protein
MQQVGMEFFPIESERVICFVFKITRTLYENKLRDEIS